MRIAISWIMTPCYLVGEYQYLVEGCFFCFQNGSSMCLHNGGTHLSDYTVS
jgi:hypothetical protein